MRRVSIGALILLAGLAAGIACQPAAPQAQEQSPSAAGPARLGVGRTEAAAGAAAAPAMAGQAAQPAGITVAGEGQVKTTPDVAQVTAGVQNNAATAQEAQQENARLMSAVLAKLQSMGYGQKDVRTSGLSVHPVYDRSGETPTGYQAVNQVVVTINDIGQAGAVYDAVVAAGANVAGNISFGLKDDSTLRQQALQQAVKAARAKADAIAQALGVTISGVDAVVEESAGGPLPVVMPGAQAAASVPTPVQPGELTVSARVQVVYRY